MISFDYLIKDTLGLHARPAGLMVKAATTFKSDIKVSCKGKTADAKRLFAVMGLQAKCGDTIVLEVAGEDESLAKETIIKIFTENAL